MLEREIAKDTSNPKKFYSYIGSRTKARTGVGPLKINGVTVSNDEEMAKELNNYFSEVFQEPDSAPPPQATPTQAGYAL